jgi:hypothetical protein
MNRTKLFASAVLLVSVALISACGDDNAPALSKTQLLTQNTWKFSSVTSTDATAQALLALFLTGSEVVFKADKTYNQTTLLGPSSGKWEFSSGETALILDKGTAEESTGDIVKLDGSNLELKEVVGTVTTTTKYVKK